MCVRERGCVCVCVCERERGGVSSLTAAEAVSAVALTASLRAFGSILRCFVNS